MGNSVYGIVTERIIKELEQGIIPWRKPWGGIYGGAYSRATGRPYSLLNQMMLEPGEYVTYKQIQEEGGKIKESERKNSSIVFFWKQNVKIKENKDGTQEESIRPVFKYYRVWNVEQCEGIEQKYKPTKILHEPLKEGEEVIRHYQEKTKIEVIIEPSNMAFYNCNSDYLKVPVMEQYDNIHKYYSTVFHEIVHSTGHVSRLNRPLGNKKGSPEYAFEELIAEMGTAYLMNQIGLETEATFENSAAYLRSWIKVLKNNPVFIARASSKAEKAAKFVLDREDENTLSLVLAS